MSHADLVDGTYYLKNPNEVEPTLVWLYTNPDTGERGFGFNFRDGGGFLPLFDLNKQTTVIKVDVVEAAHG